jgi:hypothetical protein
MQATETLSNAHSPAGSWSGGRLRPFVGLLWLTAFFYIYSVAFRALPEELLTARIVALVALGVLAVRTLWSGGWLTMDQDLVLVVSLFGLYTAWIGWRTIVTGSDDFGLLTNAALLLLQVFPGAVLLGRAFARRQPELRDFVLLLQTIITVQAVLILLSFVSWDFRMLTVKLLHAGPDQIEELQPFRVRGFTHGTGAKLSAFQAIGVLFSVYLLLGAKSARAVVYLTLSIALLVGSIFLTGRTGFIMLPLCGLFVALYASLVGRVPRGVVGAALLTPVCAIGGFIAVKSLYLSGADAAASADALARVSRWVFKELLRYGDSASIGSSTVVSLLQHHWFLPDSNFTLLFGDPSTWGLRRVHSDVGPVRMVFGTGLVGALLLYLAVATLWAAAFRRTAGFADRLMLVTLLVWLVLIELKEPMLIDPRFLSLLAVLLMFNIFARARRTGPRVVPPVAEPSAPA